MMQSMQLYLFALLLASPADLLLADAKEHVRQQSPPKKSAKTSPGGSRVRGRKQQQQRRAQDGDTTLETVGDNGIVGGVAAAVGEFPFFVKFEGGTLCGGSLISPDTILTAAHCVDTGKPNQVRVGPTEFYGGQLFDTQCAISHPNFIESSNTLLNDVAIIKLKEPITTLPDGSIIRFNNDTSYPSVQGTTLNVIGFGLVKDNGNIANSLQKLTTSFVSSENCQKTYSSSVVTSDDHICADVSNAGDCNGDSGGPVFDDYGVQVGIVSFGYGGCASAAYQDVYSNVANFAPWIANYVAGEKCKPFDGTTDVPQDDTTDTNTDTDTSNQDDTQDDNKDQDDGKDDGGVDAQDDGKDDGGGDADADADTDADTTEEDDEETTDLEAILEFLTIIFEFVQGFFGFDDAAKGGGGNKGFERGRK